MNGAKDALLLVSEEMVQWVKHLVREYEGLNSDPKHSPRHSGISVMPAFGLGAGGRTRGGELDGSRDFLARYPIQTNNSGFIERPCFKKIRVESV